VHCVVCSANDEVNNLLNNSERRLRAGCCSQRAVNSSRMSEHRRHMRVRTTQLTGRVLLPPALQPSLDSALVHSAVKAYNDRRAQAASGCARIDEEQRATRENPSAVSGAKAPT
jgi:hypothetical protein